MKIQSSKRPQQISSLKPTPNPDSGEKPNHISVKDIVTKSAFTAGGALGGTGLGVATGMAISNLSGNPIFGQFGGVVGAVGGAAAGFTASNQGVSKAHLAKSVGSWVGASVLSSGGMWAVGKASAHLAGYGASAVLGMNGALIGAVTGGLVGAAIPFIDSEGRVSNGLKNAAAVTAGGTAGVLVGSGIQALITEPVARAIAGQSNGPATAAAIQQVSQTMPQLTVMLAPLPYLGATTLALSALDFKENGYEVEKPALQTAKNTAWSVSYTHLTLPTIYSV